MQRRVLWGSAALLCLALMVGLRLVALNSDAYPRLTWSSALLTDEGFYIHSARNSVLFGPEIRDKDNWNNALIMPTLNLVQIGVFRLFGVGAIQARMISVVCSLFMLALFWFAVRRAFGVRPALWATVFLGLDHVNVLYNRMALMDTPAALALVGAFWAFVYAFPPQEPETVGEQSVAAASPGLLALSGALLGLAYATRGLTAIVLPAWFLAAFIGLRRGERQKARPVLAWLGAGLALAIGVYAVTWLLPHHAELARVNRYYITAQLLPHSVGRLLHNIGHTFFAYDLLAAYLLRHTPVQFLATLLFLLWFWRRGWSSLSERSYRFAALLVAWLLLMWAVLAVIDYSPSRYYVLFYPAMAVTAALALEYAAEVGKEVRRNAWARALLVGLIAYHVALASLPHIAHRVPLCFAAMGVAGLAAFFLPIPTTWNRADFSRRAVLVAGLLWLAVNLYWTTDWLTHLTYRQWNADRWLATHLPPGSVLLGDTAPGLCLNNHFVTVNVIKGLCNDVKPVERFAPAPRFIVMLDDHWREPYWTTHYPELTAPERRFHAFRHILRPSMTIGVYRVP